MSPTPCSSSSVGRIQSRSSEIGKHYRKMWQLVQDRDLGQHVAFVDEF
jgi:hypothetical protein